MKNRLIGLDWLRGICAISIMLYHFLGKYDITNTLNKLGIYGVSIFFILSGLSMGIVYEKHLGNFREIMNFYFRRILRITPLYIIACILILVINDNFSKFTANEIALNITTLFGFFDHDKYIAAGAWSIGNEMVYYLLTPVFIYLYNKKVIFGNITLIISLIISLYFSLFLLKPDVIMEKQWSIYINPFNNLYLYVTGIGIYYNLKDKLISNNIAKKILYGSIIIFILIPFVSQEHLITGLERQVYSVLSIAIVISFYKLAITNISNTGRLFEKFGIATYGVYILHPIVKQYMDLLIDNGFITKMLSIAITIPLSIYSYKYFESKITQIGKKINFNKTIYS